MSDLDLPYEDIPDGPVPFALAPGAIVCGGVVVRAAAIETPAAGRLPALILDFHTVDGQVMPPVVLVATDHEQLRKLVTLIDESTAAAIRAATS